jgi:antitoxin PrlF
MSEIVKAESTLTDRYQTTIPDLVRQTLGLQKRDKIRYIIQSDGTVTIARGAAINQDPLVEKFFQFLAEDIQKNPHLIQTITNAKIEHIQALVGNLEVDLDAPLEEE